MACVEEHLHAFGNSDITMTLVPPTLCEAHDAHAKFIRSTSLGTELLYGGYIYIPMFRSCPR